MKPGQDSGCGRPCEGPPAHLAPNSGKEEVLASASHGPAEGVLVVSSSDFSPSTSRWLLVAVLALSLSCERSQPPAPPPPPPVAATPVSAPEPEDPIFPEAPPPAPPRPRFLQLPLHAAVAPKVPWPLELVLESEELETEALLDKVAQGRSPSPWRGRAIDFAVRKDSTKLRAFLDGFVKKMYRGTLYNMWRKRYFENSLDSIFQTYSSRYGMDWRLRAAQAYQESRFNPKLRSWVGAIGLFQVMPATGHSLGFRNLEDPEQGTHAGVMYMQWLVGRFEPEIPFKHRLRFALAAYNAGIGHVQDARRIAREKGWNANKWFGHVEKAMLLLERPEYYRRARYGYCRGSEPVKYVSEIQNRYASYVELVAH